MACLNSGAPVASAAYVRSFSPGYAPVPASPMVQVDSGRDHHSGQCAPTIPTGGIHVPTRPSWVTGTGSFNNLDWQKNHGRNPAPVMGSFNNLSWVNNGRET